MTFNHRTWLHLIEKMLKDCFLGRQDQVHHLKMRMKNNKSKLIKIELHSILKKTYIEKENDIELFIRIHMNIVFLQER